MAGIRRSCLTLRYHKRRRGCARRPGADARAALPSTPGAIFSRVSANGTLVRRRLARWRAAELFDAIVEVLDVRGASASTLQALDSIFIRAQTP